MLKADTALVPVCRGIRNGEVFLRVGFWAPGPASNLEDLGDQSFSGLYP